MELEYLTQKYPMDPAFKNPLGRKGGGHQPIVIGDVHAGATNVVQRGYSKFRSGRKPKRNAKLALKFIAATQSSCVQRYQRIGQYEVFNNVIAPDRNLVAGSLDLSHVTRSFDRVVGGVTQTETAKFYPVHIFDLTSGNFFTPGVPNVSPEIGTSAIGRYNYAPCQWRLVAYQSGNPAGTAGDFYWLPERGQNQFGSSVNIGSHWRTERNLNSIVTGTIAASGSVIEPMFTDKCYMEWADIRMTLYGAKKQTTRFTVSLVQMNDRIYDPRQQPPRIGTINDDTTPQIYDGISGSGRTREEQDNFNAAMQQFVHPLVFHPMSSFGASTIKPFKTLMRKTFVIGPDTNVNEDDGQPNLLVKFFKRLNRIVKYGWSDEGRLGADGTVIDTASFNQFVQGQVNGYAHPRAKLYVMVTAQAYFNRGPDDGLNADVSPGMDMIIRRKIVYDHVTRPHSLPAT